MATTKYAFQSLKTICTQACHERQACADGYKQMLASENVSQMMATWRDNWEDVTESKYADIIRKELPKLYPSIKKEMNQSGIYLNECPQNAKPFVRVLITDTSVAVHIYGQAQAYVLGTAKVIAHNHSQVYNSQQAEARITLHDYAYGHIQQGQVLAYDRSELVCACHTVLDGSVTCKAIGASIRALAYLKIEAYGDTTVYSASNDHILLSGNSQIKPLNDEQ